MTYVKCVLPGFFLLLTWCANAQHLLTNRNDIYHTAIPIAPNAATAQQPNIILILADDIGYGTLTCNGGNLYSTPNIDTLAQQGMRFTQCFASPTCSPSRHLLLTGKYNFRTYYDWGKMDINQKTIGNMMRNAGYKTGFFGKDQSDGGGQAINTWGFDEYCVHDPFGDPSPGNRYKNPRIYTHGTFLPDDVALNKYGPDIVADSMMAFIKRNRSAPFFIYSPLILVHQPISPTPDDTAFANWDPKKPDTSFFRSMMLYMDKEIRQLVDALKKNGIDKNTVIFFTADNGTAGVVGDYSEDDSIVSGGKHLTTEAGNHVPLIAYWPGKISPGTTCNDLVSFTDFLPSMAGIANIPLPADFGPLDGVSFYPRLLGEQGKPRNWIFSDYVQHPASDTLKRWVQTKSYKLYDTSGSNKRLFYNISKDVNEDHPIPANSLTADEITIRQQLLDVINSYVAQGTPLLSSSPSVLSVTDSSFILKDKINANGGSTITASGAVWSTDPDPKLPSPKHTSTGVAWGPFSTVVHGLKPNTTYYVRAYATNFAGTAYTSQVTVKTLAKVPVALDATDVGNHQFTANWKPYKDAIEYRLDVSTSPDFSQTNTGVMKEGFDNGIIPDDGWQIKNNIAVNLTSFGTASPSLEFRASNDRVITKQLNDPASQLRFWVKGLNTDGLSSLLIEGSDGNSWTTIANLTQFSKTGAVKTFNANSNPPLAQNFIQFRFTYTKKTGTVAFDDVSVKYDRQVPFFVPGYKDLPVTTNSALVTGLKQATAYYYRIRAVKEDANTGNSSVISVVTKAAPLTNSSGDDAAATESNSSIHIFPNPSAAEFMLTVNTGKNETIQIDVAGVHGKVVYHATGNTTGKFEFGKAFVPGVYILRIKYGQKTQTIKLVKTE